MPSKNKTNAGRRVFSLRTRKASEPRDPAALSFFVDASGFTSRTDCHRDMQKVFVGYGYVGTNLDALHDVLTSIRTDAEIEIHGLEKARAAIGVYADTLRVVFETSAGENPHLHLRFTEE